ncbi:MAG: GDP-mannose 4,6-dehydratase, partial [Nitrospinaceae bacterium]|nr:GDP-mannose 4,6-dehydratase [Nitrospinaceae bacterium]
MKTILVTGGAGFIGSNFVMNLVQSGRARIINYDKLTYAGNLDTLRPIESDSNYSFIEGDICDQKRVHKALIEHEVDAVVNFAAESHVDRSIE